MFTEPEFHELNVKEQQIYIKAYTEVLNEKNFFKPPQEKKTA